tara:strand:- start:370 stop:843 length:474 start_codon:yes stop_codon:yes gene_type:complete
MDNIKKGGINIIGKDEKKNYLFSNVYEVAKNAREYERVVVAKNLEYTIEVSRAIGKSAWYICSHDETVVCMEGATEIYFVKPSDLSVMAPEEKEGAVKIAEEPEGKKMGVVKIKFGHQALLPAGAAYQFNASEVSVLMIQSLIGDESIERWADICEA